MIGREKDPRPVEGAEARRDGRATRPARDEKPSGSTTQTPAPLVAPLLWPPYERNARAAAPVPARLVRIAIGLVDKTRQKTIASVLFQGALFPHFSSWPKALIFVQAFLRIANVRRLAYSESLHVPPKKVLISDPCK